MYSGTIPKASEPDAKCFVLAYVVDSEWKYFVRQNTYLGVADLTDSVERAAMMTLPDAERTFGCMDVKDDWQIWSTRPGIVLDKPSNRLEILKRKAELERELASLPPCD